MVTSLLRNTFIDTCMTQNNPFVLVRLEFVQENIRKDIGRTESKCSEINVSHLTHIRFDMSSGDFFVHPIQQFLRLNFCKKSMDFFPGYWYVFAR